MTPIFGERGTKARESADRPRVPLRGDQAIRDDQETDLLHSAQTTHYNVRDIKITGA